MSLKPHEQQTLRQIEDALRAGDPKLAGMLSVFTKLTAFEAIPVDECLPVSPTTRRAIAVSRRDTASGAGVNSANRGMTAPEGNAGQADRAAEAAPAGRTPGAGP